MDRRRRRARSAQLARLENHRTPKAICHRDASQLVPGGVSPQIGKDNNGCPLQRHASCQCFGRQAVGSRHRLRELPDIQFSDHQRTSCRPTYVASTFPLWSPEESLAPPRQLGEHRVRRQHQPKALHVSLDDVPSSLRPTLGGVHMADRVGRPKTCTRATEGYQRLLGHVLNDLG